MKKFLKVLTITGIAASLGTVSYGFTKINLKNNFTSTQEITEQASDFVARKTENSEISLEESVDNTNAIL